MTWFLIIIIIIIIIFFWEERGVGSKCQTRDMEDKEVSAIGLKPIGDFNHFKQGRGINDQVDTDSRYLLGKCLLSYILPLVHHTWIYFHDNIFFLR